MDKDTRISIQRATQAARKLLEEEFRKQLEGTYSIFLEGRIADDPGEHLDENQLLIREKIIAAIRHHEAGGKKLAEAIQTYQRESAFTTLNRFVALEMLEARELVQPCVSAGEESDGFKEFTGLASGLLQLSDHGYRIYLESLFDEIGREVRVLFDRRDQASLFWPRRPALLELLDILNDADLAGVWSEDETIGWVYQYFNSAEDREKARYDAKGKPKTPQNGYELAVRNQFFTPRYVVQFLTDNTLGQTWYEMRKGETRLADELEYRVRNEKEVFLDDGEELPDDNDTRYIRHREKKDPRDLRILDPACGSGHFLLYCFDLLLVIYEEAWADGSSPASEADGRPLHDQYKDFDDLRRAIPSLILEHNLHGIDIDPRATQIAAIALWMRAQRSFRDFGLSRGERPMIRRTNIVVAEAMPGEEEILNGFVSSLDPPLLGQIVEKIVEKMGLAGEAGSLLRIREEVNDLIVTAKKQWASRPAAEQQEFFSELRRPKQGTLSFDLTGISDQQFWEQAEETILSALEAHALQAEGTEAYRRRLFAHDTVRGFAFLDVLTKRFDVVLMNPPFGETTDAAGDLAKSMAVGKTKNLYVAFVCRAQELLMPFGFIGVISSRSFVTYRDYEAYRELLTEKLVIGAMVDLGWSVLDGANVETAAYTLQKDSPRETLGPFVRLNELSVDRKGAALRHALEEAEDPRRFFVATSDLKVLPGSPLCYWASKGFVDSVSESASLFPDWAYVGLGASPHAFFFRAAWEVRPEEIGHRWQRICRGGGFSPYYRSNLLLIDWAAGGGAVKAYITQKYPYLKGNPAWKIQDEDKYFQPGLTWGKRNERFNVQLMAKGHIFTDEGQGIIPHRVDKTLYLLGVLNSAYVAYFLSLTSGLQKHYVYVRPVPIPELAEADADLVAKKVADVAQRKACWSATNEIDPLFRGPLPFQLSELGSLDEAARRCVERWQVDAAVIKQHRSYIDDVIFEATRLGASDREEAVRLVEEYSADIPGPDAFAEVESARTTVAVRMLSFAVGCAIGRWQDDSAVEIGTVNLLDELPQTAPAMKDITAGGEDDGTASIAIDGILVDDRGHPRDIGDRVQGFLTSWFSRPQELVEKEYERVLGGTDLKHWISTTFFDFHIEGHRAVNRKAPVIWQFGTQTGGYSVWLYAHRSSQDTMFRIGELVEEKIRHEENRLTRMCEEAGSTHSARVARDLAAQEHLTGELRELREEIDRVAPLWRPSLDDGVVINCAPLWRLFPQNPSWQKECVKHWKKLVDGDYDWARWAMHLWPERVVPKCAKDRSLAIAHGLEDVFWSESEDGKWEPKKVPKEMVEQLVARRSSVAVKEALQNLLDAPPPAGSKKTRRRSRKAN